MDTPLFQKNPEAYKRFLEAKKLGMSDRTACAYAGWNAQICANYKERARADEALGVESAFTKFMIDYRQAVGEFVSSQSTIVHQAAGKGQWQAAAWLLERRAPEDYALKANIGIDAGSQITIVNDVPDKE